MPDWTPELDRALFNTAQEYNEEHWEAIAIDLTHKLHVPFTADAARKRYGRIKHENWLTETGYFPPQTIEVGPAKDFVGFTLGFYDIETSDLRMMAGTVLCATVGDNWGKTTTRTVWDFPQESLIDDRGIVVWIRDELEKYDISVGWNGFMFDQSSINARLLRWGERPIRDMMAIDPMWKAARGRYGLNIGSKRLANVAKFFNSPNQKPELPAEVWILAERGDKDAMDILVERNIADVLVLRDIFDYLKPMMRTIHR